MKTLSISFILMLNIAVVFASEPKTVKLEQSTGKFNIKELKLAEGAYIFEVSNNGVDHPVAFVLTPEGKTKRSDHIKSAYLKRKIRDGESRTSKEVFLLRGRYTYFCPLNPTPLYTLVVE